MMMNESEISAYRRNMGSVYCYCLELRTDGVYTAHTHEMLRM